MDTLTYSCTFAGVRVGVRVRVPLGGGGKSVVGVVSSVSAVLPDGLKADSVRGVESVLDLVPLVSESQFAFFRWLSTYYMVGLGEVLRFGLGPLFSVGMDGLSVRRRGGGYGGAGGMLGAGRVVYDGAGYGLWGGEQDDSAIKLVRELGVDVDYCGVVWELLNDQKNGEKRGVILVLCPTAQACADMAAELSAHFSVSLYTNRMSSAARARVAVDCAMGVSAQVIVGTKAALWLNLRGLAGASNGQSTSAQLCGIVLTQEHSYHYRGGVQPYISGRESALMLASMLGVRCVVMSAYPMVESYYSSHWGTWGYAEVGGAEGGLRSIVLERGRTLLAKYTCAQIADVLKSQRRVVLLQNRRGVASFIECQQCGYVPGCVNCSVSLTQHSDVLGCHYCGYTEPVVEGCVHCGGVMESKGRGTAQIEGQLQELFPTARIVRLDSDSLSEQSREVRDILCGENQQWDIVIGTELIVEQLRWVDVGLVGVLNVDNMLSSVDFRVEERAHRTLGLLRQRCVSHDAQFVIQSSKLGHRVVDAVLEGRFAEFYDHELEVRQGAGFPPHCRMLRVVLRAVSLSEATYIARQLEALLRPTFGPRLSGMYQPVVERQRGEHLVELMLRIERGRSVARAKLLLLEAVRGVQKLAKKRKVTIEIEVDPVG